jgi:hypothetical protein
VGARSTLMAALVLTAAARAEPVRADPDEHDMVGRPLVLPAGSVDLRLTAEIGVERTTFGRPLSFAPDAWWGVAPRWTIGLIHSSASVDRIDAGASFCVRESVVPVCNRLYRGGGIDLRFGARAGALAVAPRLRVIVRDLSPARPATTLGALVRWTRGRFAVACDPYLRLPLANRTRGNRAAISIPLWLAVQPARGWMITLHTGFDADLIVLRDGSHSPFGLGVTTRLTREIDLGIEAGWARLLGPQYDAKHGAVLVTAGWRR